MCKLNQYVHVRLGLTALGIDSVTDASIWSLVEPGVAIIASSLATIRPLLRTLRIRGFQSTDKTPNSGGISGGRYAQGSRNVRTSTMPGYGPNDVVLGGMGQHKAGATATTYSGRTGGVILDDYHSQMAGINGSDESHQSDGKSEVYVIQGNKNSPTWSTQDLRPREHSLDELPDLESHGREYQSRKGWGVQ